MAFKEAKARIWWFVWEEAVLFFVGLLSLSVLAELSGGFYCWITMTLRNSPSVPGRVDKVLTSSYAFPDTHLIYNSLTGLWRKVLFSLGLLTAEAWVFRPGLRGSDTGEEEEEAGGVWGFLVRSWSLKSTETGLQQLLKNVTKHIPKELQKNLKWLQMRIIKNTMTAASKWG